MMKLRIRQLIDSLPLEHKVGQLFMLAFAGPDLAYARQLVEQYQIGGFYLTDDNAADPQQAAALNLELQKLAALRTVDAPLILGVDQEGAWSVLTTYTDTGPGNLALGVADDLALTAQQYQHMALQMQALGYNTLLAPCVDVNSNPDNPIIGQRSFGAEPALVSRHSSAAVTAILQTGMLACAKHFPGHGDTATDSHNGLPVVDLSLTELLDSHLQPFVAAIAAGVPMLMTSHICYPQLDSEFPATLSPQILTRLLREQLGFDGVILTDSMNMGAMRRHYGPVEAAVQALRAGADMIMLSEEHYENAVTDYQTLQRQTIQGVIAAVQTGELAHSVIDAALQRVLLLRYQLAEPKIRPVPDGAALAAEAARRACRVLRDQAGMLPLRQPFYLACMAEPAEYAQIRNSRGIGPNDAVPASSVVQQALQQAGAKVEVLSWPVLASWLERGQRPDLPLLLLSEDYPLPGSQLNLPLQRARIQQCLQAWGAQVVLLGLRSDTELNAYPQLQTYLCCYSSRRCSALAATAMLLARPVTPQAEPDINL
ncbi:MAG: glycoside hydrolase family 3 N-terminal domain-containing protein [Rheinheimera sp.]|nr:glycoside hydrolase family 3 N-terminal domain-containing protein [Rheinheimera sp.]